MVDQPLEAKGEAGTACLHTDLTPSAQQLRGVLFTGQCWLLLPQHPSLPKRGCLPGLSGLLQLPTWLDGMKGRACGYEFCGRFSTGLPGGCV